MDTRTITITQEMLASKGTRFINHLIDIAPQYGISYGIAYGSIYLGEYTGYYGLYDFTIGLSFIEELMFNYSLLIAYYVIFESLTFKTLGKYVTNTKVVMHNGEEPKLQEIFIRTLCRLIPFDAFSFLGTKGKGWHDSISKTYVVDIAKFEAGLRLNNELDQIGQWTE